MDKKEKETKKKYEKPSYEVDGIFEKMSLKCHEAHGTPCKQKNKCEVSQPNTRSA
jgi:hypothetical protein